MGLARRKAVSTAAAALAAPRARRGEDVPGDMMDRIRLVRAGLPSRRVPELADALGWSKEQLYRSLGVARATVDRKIRDGHPLSPGESERVLGLLQLVQDVERMYEESGDPDVVDFDPARWLGGWLLNSCPALGGERPAAFIDTADGRTLIHRLLHAMRDGVYW